MISLKEYKRRLGTLADNMSDSDILKMQNTHYILAEIALDIVIKRHLAKNKNNRNNNNVPD